MTASRTLVLVALTVLTARAAHAAEASYECPAAESSVAKNERLARELFEDATRREASDPQGALARYRCASQRADRPAIQLGIGRVAERVLAYDEAIEAFERYLALTGGAAPDAAEMREHIENLRTRRDDQAKSERPPPVIVLRPAPSPPPPPKESSLFTIGGYALLGVGAASAIVGGALLYDAKAKSDDVHASPSGTPWATASGTFDAAKTSQTVGAVFLIAAPVLVVSGILLLTLPRSAHHGSW